MGWNELANNQMPTELDAASGGFTLREGQIDGLDNKCMTANDANNKYVLDARLQVGVAGNQLLQKSKWGGTLIVTGYAFLCAEDGGVFKSTDLGKTWSPVGTIPNEIYKTVAAPLGGTPLYIGHTNGVIRESAPIGSFYGKECVKICCSDSGSTVVGISKGLQIQVSSDSGNSWTAVVTARQWSCLSMSADGQTLMAGTSEAAQSMRRSLNGGSSWQNITTLPAGAYVDCGVSGDGLTWIVVQATGFPKKSTDKGATWTDINNIGGLPGSDNWVNISISHTGQYIMFGTTSQVFFETDDFGATWNMLSISGVPVNYPCTVNAMTQDRSHKFIGYNYWKTAVISDEGVVYPEMGERTWSAGIIKNLTT